MLSLALLPSSYTPLLPSADSVPPEYTSPLAQVSPSEVIFSSRRPALLTYTSRLVSLSSRLFSLPLYILNLRSESETLLVPMGESTTFLKGWKNIPAYALLEVQAGQEVQIYDVRLNFKARFGGMRRIMYNHRILSFIVFTGMFWLTEIVFTGLAWLALSMMFAKPANQLPNGEDRKIKNEEREERTDDEPDLSDTPRTFPTYGRQPPLRYVPKVKDEEIDSEEYLVEDKDMKVEADDEDEEAGSYRDSGVGTSFSEGGERAGLARRRPRMGS